MYEKNAKLLKTLLACMFGLVFLCFTLCVSGTEAVNDAADREVKENPYFTSFSLPTLDGGTFTQEDLKDYKLTVINGWGPWCTACVSEMPALENLAQSEELKEAGVRIVSVVADYAKQQASDETYLAQCEDMVASTGVTYPVMLADERFVKEVMPSMRNSFPGTWFVDSEGNILYMWSGTHTEEDWLKDIYRVLKEIPQEGEES